MYFLLLDHETGDKIFPHLWECFSEIKWCLCQLSDSRQNVIRKLTVSSEEVVMDMPKSRSESEQISGGTFVISTKDLWWIIEACGSYSCLIFTWEFVLSFMPLVLQMHAHGKLNLAWKISAGVIAVISSEAAESFPLTFRFLDWFSFGGFAWGQCGVTLSILILSAIW